MKVLVEKVLDKELAESLYSELRESPLKVPNKNTKTIEGLVERIGKFNKKHHPYFEASLRTPSHRSNTYTVEIFTFFRDDVRKVIQ